MSQNSPRDVESVGTVVKYNWVDQRYTRPDCSLIIRRKEERKDRLGEAAALSLRTFEARRRYPFYAQSATRLYGFGERKMTLNAGWPYIRVIDFCWRQDILQQWLEQRKGRGKMINLFRQCRVDQGIGTNSHWAAHPVCDAFFRLLDPCYRFLTHAHKNNSGPQNSR